MANNKKPIPPYLSDVYTRFKATCIKTRSLSDWDGSSGTMWAQSQTYLCMTKDFKHFIIALDPMHFNEFNEDEWVVIGNFTECWDFRYKNSFIEITQEQFDEYFTTDYRVDTELIPNRWLSYKVRDDIYRDVWYEHVLEDVKSYAESEGIEISDEVAGNCAIRYVYDGRYDCNLNYWQNIANLIEENNY